MLHFTPEEYACLKYNLMGPSRKMGGYQEMENWLVDNIDLTTGKCLLDAKRQFRLISYIVKNGPGGPNGRIRKACIPALARLGINLEPSK